MAPCVIVPTFWTKKRESQLEDLLVTYSHPTSVDEDGPLPECLESLERTCGACTIIVLVASTDRSIEVRAEERVLSILREFPTLDFLVFGPAELGSLHRRLEQVGFEDMVAGATLVGYGAVRNAGLIVAATLEADTVLFIDDDQIVTDEDFLEKALYGLGKRTQKGTPVLAKTGYYVDREGAARVPDPSAWTDAFWPQVASYNRTLERMLQPPRLRKSPLAFGGCLALHRDVYCNVAFDPWVVRGEDIDYVVNLMMHGKDVFLDNAWSVVHAPPPTSRKSLGFRQDVYRFVYEHRKIEFAKSQVDLRPISPRALSPYPGEFIRGGIGWRAFATGLLRALAGSESREYLRAAREALTVAPAYAREHCRDYFEFQRRWPALMERVWGDEPLRSLFTGERRMDKAALTGRITKPDAPE
ncbi:MAG: hypothetical protein Kow0056_11050 [Coriobacteriia bacterium]